MALRKESSKPDYYSDIESNHTRLLLGLLEEYSTKLRYLYEEYIDLQLSLSTYANLLLPLLALVAFGSSFFLSLNLHGYSTVPNIRLLIAVSTIIFVILIGITFWRRVLILRSRRRRLRLEIEVMSATLKRLIQRSSDINEHVDVDLNERLVLDARLAEAEGILKYSDMSERLRSTSSIAN